MFNMRKVISGTRIVTVFLLYILAFVFSVFLLLMVAHTAFAQEVLDLTRTVRVEAEDQASAKQALMQRAVEEVTFENVKNIIGIEKTERSRDTIQNKIVRDSGRYVLSMSGQNFSKQEVGYSMDVTMKVSIKGLRTLLLEQGLLYQMDGPPKVLPVVLIMDRVNSLSYGWWYQNVSRDQTYLMDLLQQLHQSLKSGMQKIGFYTMTPITGQYSGSVPEVYRGENLQKADFLFLGEYFKSSIVIKGRILLKPKPTAESVYLIEAHLEALHTTNGRLIAEVSRTFETAQGNFRSVMASKFESVAPKMAEDLSVQLNDAWKKGTFGASIYRLAIQGNTSPLVLDEFKKAVVLQVHDIKSLRERLIESGRTTYEVDSSVIPQRLAQVFRSTQFQKFRVYVENVSGEGLTLSLVVRN